MAFLISNIIIAILVLESKFMADEYVKRNDCMLTVPRLLHTATTQPYEREAVEEEEEELEIMPVDELNRRVEDFIARFKQHLRLEAQREKRIYIGGAGGRAVDQSQSESGGADFLLKKKHCMHCKLFMKHCCGYFCCSVEEYARYMKGEAAEKLPVS
ncbi:hypothetical protein EJ110_NYTH40846 [Nymphaea thermarum]|nr:hypothetical protein EJ110_NYTH40846 [Nymphaea thermarum]